MKIIFRLYFIDVYVIIFANTYLKRAFEPQFPSREEWLFLHYDTNQRPIPKAARKEVEPILE